MDMQNLLKQAQNMQEKMKEAHKELSELVITTETGGGLVKVEVNGNHYVKIQEIDNSLLNVENKEMLQDLIAAAVNKGVDKIKETSQEKLNKLTAGLELPKDFDLPDEE